MCDERPAEDIKSTSATRNCSHLNTADKIWRLFDTQTAPKVYFEIRPVAFDRSFFRSLNVHAISEREVCMTNLAPRPI